MAAPAVAGLAAAEWHRAVYYDTNYPSAWASSAEVRDALIAAGYTVLDANQLEQWMTARITDGQLSVVVFSQDIVPDTVAESRSSSATIRRYLNAGGKVVWYGDIPMYYQGHADGSRTTWDTAGSTSILGFNAAGGDWNSDQPVTITADGAVWGLQQTWQSLRPALSTGLRVLARDVNNHAAAWVRHYGSKDTFRGFVRFFDRGGSPDANAVLALAEYAPPVLVGDNLLDNIVATFHYPWYGNPATSGRWIHWDDSNFSPPLTWTSNYLPSFPDSTWNPPVQLYDSSDPALLRWQDGLMARAGIDIAVSSWWGYPDTPFAKACRLAKSVQWCIYYELESVGDPTPQKIHDDLKYVIDAHGPTRNYAKIDGKWLVVVYAASGSEVANRWRQAKAMLAAEGYQVYLNGDVGDPSTATVPDPWDAVHSYSALQYHSLNAAPAGGDSSSTTSPGFSRPAEAPLLDRSLSTYTASWNTAADSHQQWRFHFFLSWSEWHEGTQIEPGQEIVPDLNGFYPAGNDYGTTYLDVITPRANVLRWQSIGHRPVAPVRLEAETMVWELGTVAEGSSAWRLPTNGPRIGASFEMPESEPAVWLVTRARAVRVGADAGWPDMMVYLDNNVVAQNPVQSTGFVDHRVVVPVTSGVHSVEVSMSGDPGGTRDVDLAVDFVEVYVPGPGGDFDADTVTDETDNCPTMPNGGQEDEDFDGVGDSCDVCPGTIPGAAVDANGCPPPFPGDLDRDGDVDQSDFGILQACLSGESWPFDPGCRRADLEGDGDVDGGDLASFVPCMAGAGRAPGC